MMKRICYILLCLLPCMTACQQKDSPEYKGEGVPIMLSAGIDPTEPATRAAYQLTHPTTEEPLHAAVWLSTSGNFLNNNTGDGTSSLEAETSIFFQNEKDQLLKMNRDAVSLDIIYPSECDDAEHQVHFIGLHPDGGWGFTSGSTNSSTFHTFDGNDDLMFAPKVSGFIAINPNPKLHFYHMLTHLRLEVKAENADVTSSWGKLERISLSLQKSKLTLSNLTTAPSLSTVSFEDDASLPFYATGGDITFEAANPSGYALPTVFTEVAYVLCTPVTATREDGGDRTDEYSILLDTEKRSNVEVKVDLKTGAGTADSDYFSGSTMGREFVITLTFTASGYVSASATVSAWTTGGYVSQDVER